MNDRAAESHDLPQRPEHQRPAEEGPSLERSLALSAALDKGDKTVSPKVGVPAFVLAVYGAILATLAWQGVTVPPEVAGGWGAVLTLGSGWLAPRA